MVGTNLHFSFFALKNESWAFTYDSFYFYLSFLSLIFL